MNFDFETSFIILGNLYCLLKLVSVLSVIFWTRLSLVILINLGFRQKPKFFKISVGFVKFAKWYQDRKKPKWQDTQKSLKNQDLQESQN